MPPTMTQYVEGPAGNLSAANLFSAPLHPRFVFARPPSVHASWPHALLALPVRSGTDGTGLEDVCVCQHFILWAELHECWVAGPAGSAESSYKCRPAIANLNSDREQEGDIPGLRLLVSA
eukprot:1142839-Pelagomonas_calceolata.AAC.1